MIAPATSLWAADGGRAAPSCLTRRRIGKIQTQDGKFHEDVRIPIRQARRAHPVRTRVSLVVTGLVTKRDRHYPCPRYKAGRSQREQSRKIPSLRIARPAIPRRLSWQSKASPRIESLALHRGLVGVDIPHPQRNASCGGRQAMVLWAPLVRRWQSYRGEAGPEVRYERTGTAQRPLTSKCPTVLCEIEQ